MRWLFFTVLFANFGVVVLQLMPGDAEATAASAPDPGAKRLVLLSEKQTDSPTTSTPAVETTASTTTTEPAQICYTLGPFKSEDLVERARAELASLDLEASLRERNEREQYGYQVYLPALKTRQEAIKAARELADKGIKEYYVMTEKDFQNAVSLGLFKAKRSAEKHVSSLQRKGVFPEMVSRYRDLKLYWLDYADTAEELSPEYLRALFAGEAVQRLQRDCG